MTRHLAGLHVQRHISRSTRWTDNDLNDLMFLACAAGYADHVVAETTTGTQLRQLRHAAGGNTTVHRSLEELVQALHRQGVTTATERGQSSANR